MAPPINVPPVLLDVVLEYHWYVELFPGTVTLIDVKLAPKQILCVNVLCEVINVDNVGLTTIAPDTALV